MAVDDTVVVWNPAGLLEVAHSEQVHAEIAAIGDRIAVAAKSAAPRGTGTHGGHGADTIHAVTVFEDGEWAARVSWDQLHAYMRHPERGTRYQPGQHFLLHSVDRYAR